jgi:hypothetical protein
MLRISLIAAVIGTSLLLVGCSDTPDVPVGDNNVDAGAVEVDVAEAVDSVSESSSDGSEEGMSDSSTVNDVEESSDTLGPEPEVEEPADESLPSDPTENPEGSAFYKFSEWHVPHSSDDR